LFVNIEGAKMGSKKHKKHKSDKRDRLEGKLRESTGGELYSPI
jgi:hypothetical protein